MIIKFNSLSRIRRVLKNKNCSVMMNQTTILSYRCSRAILSSLVKNHITNCQVKIQLKDTRGMKESLLIFKLILNSITATNQHFRCSSIIHQKIVLKCININQRNFNLAPRRIISTFRRRLKNPQRKLKMILVL